MKRHEKNGIQWLTFDIFNKYPEIVHGFVLRHGGVSSGCCTSLNLSFCDLDSNENVLTNRSRVLQALQIKNLVSVSQKEHSDKVIVIENCSQDGEIADGLITKEVNTALMTKSADCQIAIVYDPVKRVIANIHAGWRGMVKDIYGNAINKMVLEFDCNPQDLCIGIGPSLGPKHAEFRDYKELFPLNMHKYRIEDSLYFDLWTAAEERFIELGVKKENIECARICTHDNEEDYFSYRRDKAQGRHGIVVMLVK